MTEKYKNARTTLFSTWRDWHRSRIPEAASSLLEENVKGFDLLDAIKQHDKERLDAITKREKEHVDEIKETTEKYENVKAALTRLQTVANKELLGLKNLLQLTRDDLEDTLLFIRGKEDQVALLEERLQRVKLAASVRQDKKAR